MKEVEGGTMYTNYEYPGSIPLYTHPAKYCPSENNEAYEKGFIDGMAKMTESAVHRAVESMAVKELSDEEIEQVRITIMNTAYWCADENMSEAYNAVKVCCSEVLAILRKAQEK
jgi:hypothetical protein